MNGRRPLPVPDDFLEVAAVKTHKQLIAHYGASSGVISRWRLETNAPTHTRGKPLLQIPADFAEQAKEMTWSQLRAHYGVANVVIQRWRMVAGIELKKTGRPPQPAPNSFRSVATTMLPTQMAAHYGVGKVTIYRWFKETGVKPLRKENALVTFQNMGKRTIASAMVAPTQRDMSLAGRAADFLQKRGPIHRCDFFGRFELGGAYWKWRGEAYSDADIVEAAKERGFDPDAWRQLGAAA